MHSQRVNTFMFGYDLNANCRKGILVGCLLVATGAMFGCSRSGASKASRSKAASDSGANVRLLKDKQKRVVGAEIEKSTDVAAKLEELRKHDSLREIVLIQCGRIRPGDIVAMKEFENLSAVEFVDCKVDETTAVEFAKLSQLKQLTFAATPLTAETLASLRACGKLEGLTLRVGGFDREALIGLKSLKQLKQLSIDRRGLKFENLAVLEYLPQLQSLHLPESQPTTDDVKTLPRLPELREIKFIGGSITDAGADSFRKFPKLESLNFSGSKVSDDALSVLSHLPHLKTIDITSCSILTDKSLPHLLKLPAIEEIHMIDTGITAEGFLKLAELKTLKKIVIRRGLIDSKQLETFQKSHPACKVVQVRRPPKLG